MIGGYDKETEGALFFERRSLIESEIGPEPPGVFARLDWRFTHWLIEKSMGPGEFMLSPRFIFWRCGDCGRPRTQKAILRGFCECGARKLRPMGGKRSTWKILWWLLRGH